MRSAVRPVTITQEDFLDNYFTVHPGEHISLLGPTGTGKTTLGMRMLPVILAENPRLRVVVFATKPHRRNRKRTGDATLSRYATEQKARVIRTWTARRIWRRQRLFVLWPIHKFDDFDEARHAEIFAQALLETYKEGDWIVLADEAYTLSAEYGLSKSLVRIWTKGRSMETALIAATQKPTHVPLWMYSQAEHLFLWRDPDMAARKRYAEIGGFDPRALELTLDELDRYSCLYLRRSDRAMCIVSG